MLAYARVHLAYLACHHRLARLSNPMLFTEHVQHRKLHDRNAAFPRLADKLLAKTEVAAVLGREWIIPTLWHGLELPARPRWPLPFVLKSRHGCNQFAFIRSPGVDWAALRQRAERWTRGRYGYWLDEWLYSQIERGLLIEPFIGKDGVVPIDYKLFVFGGRVTFVQVHLERETAHRWVVLDRDWRQLTVGRDAPPSPRSLPAMIQAAEILGRGFEFVRIDFYDVDGEPKFGEMTFYPGSGLLPIKPGHLDLVMGSMWREAAGRMQAAEVHTRPAPPIGDMAAYRPRRSPCANGARA